MPCTVQTPAQSIAAIQESWETGKPKCSCWLALQLTLHKDLTFRALLKRAF